MIKNPFRAICSVSLALLSGIVSLALPASADGSLIFNTSDSPFTPGVANQGWWTSTYANEDREQNYAVGRSADLGGVEFRNFFSFDLRSLDLEGLTIVGATLELRRYQYLSPDPTETLEFHDVSTAAAILNNNVGTSATIFDDLGSGVSYGSFVVSESGAGTETLSFSLNSAAISDIVAAAGDSFFSIGGAVRSLGETSDNELLFAYSFPDGCGGVQRLLIDTQFTAVPEPGTGLWAIGLLLSMALRPSRRRQA
ncbi:MAG: PEP-CTERM sorting domain-containing protein [Verrucomicrobiota bacterium]|nr:PEP-CTERM sorting domain-containing protein [Verrucomicrobiota bacterium]